ncbi:MAG: hypothetical protein HRT87_01760, partial [Legionellales bacterium]|nr:hypothetical protein [Legionellales bacterium]
LNKKILRQIEKTLAENVTNQKAKEQLFNAEFNESLDEDVFITTSLRGLNINIEITNLGNVALNIYDRQTNTQAPFKLVIDGRDILKKIKDEGDFDLVGKIFTTYETKKDEYKKSLKSIKNKSDKAKKQKEAARFLKLELNKNNLRYSFEKESNVNKILTSTTTQIRPEIRVNQTMNLIATNHKPVENVTVIQDSVKRVKRPAKTPKSVTPTPESTPATKTALSQEKIDYVKNLDNSGLSDKEKEEALALLEDINNAIEDREKILRKENPKVSQRNIRRFVFNKDSKIKELLELKSYIDRKLMANKIVHPLLSEKDIDDIDTFLEWGAANLPEFIRYEDLSALRDNLITNGVRVGAFMMHMHDAADGVNVGGTIYIGARTPFKYHEAFHAVFRLMLTDAQQEKYLKIAYSELRKKYGSSLKTELEKFRNSWEGYKNMSDARLLQEFAEEYLADEFQKFKTNPRSTKTNSAIKNFFNKLVEWLKSIFTKYNRNDLQNLYENIDSGKFKSGSPVNNQFTIGFENGISYANKIIPYERIDGGSGKFGFRSLDAETSKMLLSSIVARVIDARYDEGYAELELRDVIEDVLVDFEILYDTSSGSQEAEENGEYYENVLGLNDYKDFDELDKIHTALTEFKLYVIDAVEEQLQFYDLTQREKEELEEEQLDEMGSRVRLSTQWDKDADTIGGFKSLSLFLRKYIGTTKLDSTDKFGNQYLIRPGLKDEDGNELLPVPLKVTVDFSTAYNGFLKAVKNLHDPVQILQQLYFFSENNPHTRAVVNRLFNDLGIQWEGQLEIGELPLTNPEAVEKLKNGEDVSDEELGGITNPLLFQAVIKGFENARIDYLFVHKQKDGDVAAYTAANRDDAHTQVQRWASNSIGATARLNREVGAKEQLLNQLSLLKSILDPEKTVTDEQLNEYSVSIAQYIEDYTGISLSPYFIKFSVAFNTLTDNQTNSQKALVRANSKAEPLTTESINELIALIDAGQDLFSDNRDIGAKSRLNQIAINNAEFDETVGASVFKNPNGDFVFAHQLPSYHIKKVNSLNDSEALEELKEDSFLEKNHLLNDPAFKQLSRENRLRIMRMSGSKEGGSIQSEGGVIEEDNSDSEGKTYGDFTPKEFVQALINAYIGEINNETGEIGAVEYINENGDVVKKALAPVLIRVLEASNTGDMVSLPVIKATQWSSEGNVEITDEVLEALYNSIEAEFNRIVRESNSETATKELLVGYNAKSVSNDATGTAEIVRIDANSDDVNKGRAFKFHKTGVLLESTVKKARTTQNKLDLTVKDKFNYDLITEGNQGVVLYSVTAAEKAIKFTEQGLAANATFGVTKNNKVEKVNVNVESLGKVNVKTLEEQTYYIEMFGDAISEYETDNHTHKVRVGDKQNGKLYYTTPQIASFLNIKSDVEFYAYKIEPGLIDKNSSLAEQQSNLLKNLTDAARNPENKDKSLEEVFSDLGLNKKDFLRSILANRLRDEFNEFKNDLNDLLGSDFGINFLNGLKEYSSAAKTAETAKLLNLVSDELDYNLMQIFLNDYVNTMSMNEVLLGDSARTLKDAVDEIKRAKAQSASYYSAASTIASPKHGIYKPAQKASLFATTDPTAPATHSNNTTEVADAQLWMTTKAFRHFTFGFGKLTDKFAELIDKVERGEELTPKEFDMFVASGEMINSKKYVYADGETFVKMSAFALLPQYTSLKDENGEWTIPKPNRVLLHNMRINMEAYEKANDTIAVSAPTSAIKMMKRNVTSIHTVTGSETKLTKDQETLLDLNFLGLQVLNPSNKLKITDPTQIKALVTSEQSDDTMVVLNGNKVSIGQIRKAYHKATKHRGELSYINKRNLIFNFDIDFAIDELNKSLKSNEISADLYSYLKYAQASIGSTGSATHLMELFDTDDNGNPKYNLNNPLTYDKFLNLFMSYFSKTVFNEKIPGATISLVSDHGARIYRKVYSVDANGMPGKHEVIREDQFFENYSNDSIVLNIDDGQNPGSDNNLSTLKTLVEQSNGQGVIIVDRLRHNLTEYDSEGNPTNQTYGELILPAHHRDVLEHVKLKNKNIPEAINKAFAVRIPSQDNHSTYNVRIVDFMPTAYGSSGVFAREIVEISGADFDIDKVFMQFKEFFYNGKTFEEYGKAKTVTERYDHYIRYVNTNVKKSGSIYNEALKKKRPVKRELTDDDIKQLKEMNNLSDASIKALQTLGMPLRMQEYEDYIKRFGHEPYTGAVNNDILDYKYALMGNNHVTQSKPLFLKKINPKAADSRSIQIDDQYYSITEENTGIPYIKKGNTEQERTTPISYQPADLDALFDVVDFLKAEVPELLEKTKEEGASVDNLLWKTRMYKNNKTGARSIGAVVLPNVYLNLLGEHNVEIHRHFVKGTNILPTIEFNSNEYYKFNTTHEILPQGSNEKFGYRTQYVLSGLITAATDNAKERLLAKLGLNINALSLAANLTKLGVPLRTSILFLNNPLIQNVYFQKENGNIKTGVGTYIKDILPELEAAIIQLAPNKYAEKSDISKRVSLTDANLIKAIKEKSVENISFLNDFIEEAEELKTTDKAADQLVLLYNILEQFLVVDRLGEETSYMKELVNLSAGLGQGISSISNKKEALKKIGLIQSEEDVQKALSAGVLMFDARKVFSSNTIQGGYVERFEQFANVLLPKVALTAKQEFIDIVDRIVENSDIVRSKKLYKENEKEKIGRDLISYLTLRSYLHSLSKKENLLQFSALSSANTMLYPQFEEGDKITDIINRLRIRYEDTNYFLNNFIIAEESSNPKNKTGMSFIGANTFMKYNDSLKIDIQNGFLDLYMNPETRHDAIKILHYVMAKDGLQYGYKSLIEAIAPITLTSAFDKLDYVQDAFEDPTGSTASKFNEIFGLSFEELIEDFYKNYLGSSSRATLAKTVKPSVYNPYIKELKLARTLNEGNIKKLAEENENDIYVYPSDLGSGKSGYKRVEDLDNTLGIVFFKDSENNTFNTLEQFIKAFDKGLDKLEEAIENAQSQEGLKVIMPAKLLPHSLVEVLKEKSLNQYEYARRRLKEVINYDLDPTDVYELDVNIKDERSGKYEPIYVDKTNKDAFKLIVNLDSSVALSDQTKPYVYRKLKKIENKKSEGFRKRLKRHKRLARNFVPVGDENMNFKFPYVIRMKEKSRSGGKFTYYKLKFVQGSNAKSQDYLLNSEVLIPIGNYAEYEEVELVGSFAQSGIGFLFGERPPISAITEYVKEHAEETNEYDETDEFNNLDFDVETTGVKIKNSSNVVANEKEIKVDGENIADVKNTKNDSAIELNDEETEQDFDIEEVGVAVSFDKLFKNNETDKTNTSNVEDFADAKESFEKWWDENVTEDDKMFFTYVDNEGETQGIQAFNAESLLEYYDSMNLDEVYESANDFLNRLKKCYLK